MRQDIADHSNLAVIDTTGLTGVAGLGHGEWRRPALNDLRALLWLDRSPAVRGLIGEENVRRARFWRFQDAWDNATPTKAIELVRRHGKAVATAIATKEVLHATSEAESSAWKKVESSITLHC